MTQQQKAWMFDTEPTVKFIVGQEGDHLIEVRPTRYPIFYGRLAGVGETLEEAVGNAIALNGYQSN